MNISIIAIIIGSVAVIGAAAAAYMTIQNKKRLNDVTSNIDSKNLEEIVNTYVKQLKINRNEMQNIQEEFKKIRKETLKSIQKVGIVRFQAFKDTGGDQSFAITLLDNNEDGFIISSLHGRDVSKMYIKQVENGESQNYKLTEEEQESLNKALQS